MYNNLFGTYASVKKPTPATTQTLAWNQLGERKLNQLGAKFKSRKHKDNLREFGIVELG